MSRYFQRREYIYTHYKNKVVSRFRQLLFITKPFLQRTFLSAANEADHEECFRKSRRWILVKVNQLRQSMHVVPHAIPIVLQNHSFPHTRRRLHTYVATSRCKNGEICKTLSFPKRISDIKKPVIIALCVPLCRPNYMWRQSNTVKRPPVEIPLMSAKHLIFLHNPSFRCWPSNVSSVITVHALWLSGKYAT